MLGLLYICKACMQKHQQYHVEILLTFLPSQLPWPPWAARQRQDHFYLCLVAQGCQGEYNSDCHVPLLLVFLPYKHCQWKHSFKGGSLILLPFIGLASYCICSQKSNIHRMFIGSQFTFWLLNQWHYNQVPKLVFHRFLLNFSLGLCGLVLFSDF